MSEDVKPKKFFIQNPHLEICTWTKYSAYEPEVNPSIEDEIEVIELEPTMRLMDELAEALEQRKCDEAINNEGSGMFNKHDSNCAKCFILEKYRKFLEGIEK